MIEQVFNRLFKNCVCLMIFTIFKENPKYMTKMKKFKVIEEAHLSSLDIAHIKGGHTYGFTVWPYSTCDNCVKGSTEAYSNCSKLYQICI